MVGKVFYCEKEKLEISDRRDLEIFVNNGLVGGIDMKLNINN